MTKPAKLRFLLSLGNTKIVLLEDAEKVELYSNSIPSSKSSVQNKRVLETLCAGKSFNNV